VVIFIGTSGKDNFTGGAGNDAFYFSAANLANTDLVKGGAGTNYLEMTSAGAVLAGGVSGVGVYQLGNGAADSLTLTGANFAGVAGHAITVIGGNAGNRLSEAGVAAADKAVLRGGGRHPDRRAERDADRRRRSRRVLVYHARLGQDPGHQ
jgi:Ca2+-binding RTX toxin-like protein